ncbi:MAG: hypothetical protein KKC64_12935, partial [Spirochaetes bacterium]|nr:hypothetical protein [Spirochaetota bacterium]
MKRHWTAIIALSLLTASALVSAQEISTVLPPSAAATAAGGLHAALPGSFQAFFTNPAGFAMNDSKWGIADLSLNLSGPVFDLLNQLPSMLNGNIDLAALLPALIDDNGRLYAAIDLAGPLAFGYVGHGLGFGFFNRSQAIVNVSSPFYAAITVREELLFAGGYAKAFKLSGNQVLELGIMPKGFIRAELSSTGNLFDVMAVISDPASLMEGQPFRMISAAGFDLGASWRYDDSLALALVCRDAFSPALVSTYSSLNSFLDGSATASAVTEPALIPADLSFGIYYLIKMDLLRRLGLQWEVMADYRDILDLFKPVSRH